MCPYFVIYSGEPHLVQCGKRVNTSLTSRRVKFHAPTFEKEATNYVFKVVNTVPYGPCYLQTVPSTLCLRADLLNRYLTFFCTKYFH